MKLRKKLIEVALPLEAINAASAREKSIRHGHPSTLHLWWARRPLAAARAVIFSQMVDDPSSYAAELLSNAKNRESANEEFDLRRKAWSNREILYERAGREQQSTVPPPGPQPTLEECAADLERERLFVIIRQLVLWENTTNEIVLTAAREELWKSWRRTCSDNKDHPRARELFNLDRLPAFHDPFAGGGALPLEAQRLGLEAYASDLNPVSVLINKAMIEIPPKFAGRDPVNPESQRQKSQMGKSWQGAQGLAEDVRYYGQWMRDEAEKRIGHLYPKIEVTAQMAKDRPDLNPLVGKKLTVIAFLWARTIKSPNPAFSNVKVPLASTFILSKMKNNEAYVEPVTEGGDYRFTVKVGTSQNSEAAAAGTKAAKRGGFRCTMSGVPIPYQYIREEASAGRMSERLMAIVGEGERGRVYLSPNEQSEAVAQMQRPSWLPNTETQGKCRVNIGLYGMTSWDKLFTARQLVAMTTFSELVQEARKRVADDALAVEALDVGGGLDAGGTGATAYADAVAVYLALVVSSLSDRMSTICTWDAGGPSWGTKTRNTFARQAIPMSWDFAEVNPLSSQSGSFGNSLGYTAEGITTSGGTYGFATQTDATTQEISRDKIVSTDPPYFDNISYADLSDYFYVWQRRSLRPVFPDLFATLAVPKAEELVATPYRHHGKEEAEQFFLDGMTQAMHHLAERAHPAFPVTIYYAFKQSETESVEGTSSTGWETFLEAVILAGFGLSGTWPIRTELSNRMIGSGANALASSIVLVCRPRPLDAPDATRREFLTALKAELPAALAYLQRGNIAPVDLAQAAIGPGMAVYTRYSKVLDASGKALSVREALALINQVLDEALAEQEGDFDADTRWALAWFDHAGFAEGEYGVAETLSKAKNTSIEGLMDEGILVSKAGKVRLLRPSELATNWYPSRDDRLTVWEMVHHLIRVLEATGENGAAELFHNLGIKVETARELPYRLYTICERKKRAQEALSYNALVQSWPEISRLARENRAQEPEQAQMFQQR